jgi:hypothetical protein
MALGSTQPLTEMSTRNLPGGKKRPARRAYNLTALRATTACTRITLPLSLRSKNQTWIIDITAKCVHNLKNAYVPSRSLHKITMLTHGTDGRDTLLP